jgi:hypothetical protein
METEYEETVSEEPEIDNYYADFATDSSSINTEILKEKKILNDYKKMDKGYNIVKRKINGNFIKIEFYDTNYTMGTIIRNAVTGAYQKGCLMGSSNENLFFKVADVSAESKNKESKILFFDSPEQWERHFFCTCPTEIKEKWKEKYLIQRMKNKFEKPADIIRATVVK